MTSSSEGMPCPVVGIGASAGGLEAFSQLLRALPTDTGMAFVVVQHLAAAHASILADLLSKVTTMPVTEVAPKPRAQPEIEPNHVYVLPPGQSMTLKGSKLQLSKREEPGQPRVIDKFFTSLAKERGHLAVGVILSGTATDGTLGLEEIKAAGGITFAQDSSAPFSGMPRSAIDSGCIDYELPPARIAQEIARIYSYPLVSVDEEKLEQEPDHAKADISAILELLRNATGADFSQYQPNTLHRRIKRRMILSKVKGTREYLRLLRDQPSEAQSLYQDVLINVTSFFRDPETFEALQSAVIPKLLAERSGAEPVRVWIVGCATGEEVYSLAMQFAEAADGDGNRPNIQIFATDLSGPNIEKARAGAYPKQRVQDLKPERLHRFFTETEGVFRVIKPIREMCVFAKHDVVADPPFSRMDLVSCRNLLIYLQPELQERVLRTLHFALNPNGFLVLGSSETVGQTRELFRPLDAKHRIFTKNDGRPQWTPAHPPNPKSRAVKSDVPADDPRSHDPVAISNGAPGSAVHREAERLLLARFAPPAVLVNRTLEILHVRGDTDPYLTISQGRPSLNLLKTTREGLRIPMGAAIQRALNSNGPIREENIVFTSGKVRREVTLDIVPVRGRSPAEGAFLVLFEEGGKGATEEEPETRHDFPHESLEAQIARLEQELTSTREYLQSVIEQAEATNEELQSANEEAQSSNEELQSINEELETSKEEIQSSNEELITVNDELQSRNAEVSQANNDLMNLIGSVDTAIVMVGLDLCIRRFSSTAEKLLNVIPTDVGRPITNIRMNIEDVSLKKLLTEAIETASYREADVQDSDGRWFSLRIRPYVTIEKRIEGAVMMLVDIDVIKRARDYAESIIATVHEPIAILDETLTLRSANPAFRELFEIEDGELKGRLIFEIGGKQWKPPELRRLLKSVLPMDAAFDDFELTHDFERIGKRTMLFSGRRLRPLDKEAPLILLVIEDVTDRRQAEADLASEEQGARIALERVVGERTEELNLTVKELEGFCYTVAHDLRTPLRGIIFNSSLLLEELAVSASEDQLRMLKSQVSHGIRLSGLIDDLLEFSRILNRPLRRRRVDVTALVREVFEESLHARGPIAGTLHVEENMHCQADPLLLRMVFANLIENACKFSPEGGRLTIGCYIESGRPVFFVKDEGIGFDMAYAQKVFEPFERLDNSQDIAGTGIGLATAKRIVERHGGLIWAISEPGKGAAFFFTLMPGIHTSAKPAKA